MKAMNIVNAVNDALDIKLTEDKTVVVYGEDAGFEGGVFRVTEGLQQKHGVERVFDSPLAESGIAGTAVGMAAAGLRPVIEMQFCGFIYPAFNQIISHITRMHNRSRGKYKMPIVIRLPYGGGINALEHHSESMEAMFAHIPGLKIVVPSTPHDAKGLLISAIESDDPVLFLEPKRIYRAIKQEVSEEKFTVPIGKAKVLSQGTDVTVVAYGAMIREAQKAMVMAKEAGYSVELIDLRTIYPLDKETITSSVKKTGRIIFVGEEPRSFGVGAEIMALANEEAFLHLEAPPKRVTAFDVIVPYPRGEHHYMITPDKIFYEIERTIKF
ncbi:MAG: alpha-ketoacid dehydrogenase subunit beta [Bacteroidales bacterium]|jgi:pyruvate dehydrogenase E1 component beta subunit|nr:alpha-ketoacid dehydrogenase subunit beta [Bacteroidales bacterium]